MPSSFVIVSYLSERAPPKGALLPEAGSFLLTPLQVCTRNVERGGDECAPAGVAVREHSDANSCLIGPRVHIQRARRPEGDAARAGDARFPEVT